MTRIAVLLLVLGIGSFILPLFGLQFRLLNLFGDAQPIASIVMALVGGALLVAQMIRSRSVVAGK
jgi:hypothetical protein